MTAEGIKPEDKRKKRLAAILSSVAFLLLVPAIAMRFSAEVRWTLLDFTVAGILLLGAGAGLDQILHRMKNKNKRIMAIILLIATFLLIWAELAVGF